MTDIQTERQKQREKQSQKDITQSGLSARGRRLGHAGGALAWQRDATSGVTRVTVPAAAVAALKVRPVATGGEAIAPLYTCTLCMPPVHAPVYSLRYNSRRRDAVLTRPRRIPPVSLPWPNEPHHTLALSDDLITAYHMGGCMEGCTRDYRIRHFPPQGPGYAFKITGQPTATC